MINLSIYLTVWPTRKPALEAAAEKIQAIYRGRMVREQQARFGVVFMVSVLFDPC